MEKNNKFKTLSILLLIILIGIFLRTYNFHDWLRFNADQGRDAELVSSVADGKTSWPLLGPKAGGTEFKLGPAFYYFEIVSAKIFGSAPDKMAYPDLFSGILCIPLLFLFLRKYFDKKTSLSLVAIFAVSAYAVRYARFAWNPNSTPFWTILALYAIHEVISQGKNRKLLWSAVAGVAIGIGVQLHTTLLLFLPITTIIIFGYLAIKNIKIIKYFFIVLAMVLLINVPQFVHEYQHNGENIKAFFGGVKTKQEKNSIVENVLHDSSCWVQGNIDIISGYEISDTCSFDPGNKDDLVVFVLGSLFVLGGAILGLRYFLNEKDADKKAFLGIIFAFIAVSYLIFIQIAFELSVRFYLVLIFLPFILLGFWIKFFWEKFRINHNLVLMIVAGLFIFSNLFFIYKSFVFLADYDKKGGTVDVIILKQAEEFSNFITANSGNAPEVVIDGNGKFLFKAYKSIKYLVEKNSNAKLLLANTKTATPSQYFYIGRLAKKAELLKDPDIKISQYKTYGKFTILFVQNNKASTGQAGAK